jgi:hypothetical protein
MIYYTYIHRKASDGVPFYIGKGTGNRFKSSDPRNAHWLNIVKKHGFKAEIVARWETDSEASEHEILLIDCFKNDLGIALCNMTNGGDGRRGVTNTLAVRKKHSERMKDPSFNPSKRPEVKLKLAGENNPMFGFRGKLSPHYGKKRPDQQQVVVCPHCKKAGMAAGMRRWHMDHCKLKVSS